MVSIIIPLYNKEFAIEQTLFSVIKQTYCDFEIIVSDDGSTDRSASIVKELAKKDKRIRYYKKKTVVSVLQEISACQKQMGNGLFFSMQTMK